MLEKITDSLFGNVQVTRIGDLVVDACVSSSFVFDAVMTEHPVEEGIAISDHHRPLPNEITIEGIITASPISEGYPYASTVNSIKALATGNNDFIKDGLNILKGYRDNSTKIEVETSLMTFQNMLVTSFVPQRNDSFDKLNFTITVKEARIVKTGTAGLLALGKDVKTKTKKQTDNNGADGKTQQSKPKEKQGKQSSSQATKSEETKGQSILDGFIFG